MASCILKKFGKKSAVAAPPKPAEPIVSEPADEGEECSCCQIGGGGGSQFGSQSGRIRSLEMTKRYRIDFFDDMGSYYGGSDHMYYPNHGFSHHRQIAPQPRPALTHMPARAPPPPSYYLPPPPHHFAPPHRPFAPPPPPPGYYDHYYGYDQAPSQDYYYGYY